MFALFPSRAVAFILFGFPVHWYGLLYLASFLLAMYLLPRLQKYRQLQLTKDDWMSLLSWSVLGVIVGGRLGFVLFYQPAYFLEHPAEVVAVWNGGMAFHGGFLGVALAVLLFCRARHTDAFRIADTVVVPVAIGLALGRIGNFLNQELYGIPTSLPWGIAIPGVEGLRHPTQIYAFLKDVTIAGAAFLYMRRDPPKGSVFALFLTMYGFGRFMLEYLREQDYPWTVVAGIPFTRAQLLTGPMFLAGVVMWIWAYRRSRHA